MVLITNILPQFYIVREVCIYADDCGKPVSRNPQAGIFSNHVAASSVSEHLRHPLDEHNLSKFNESLLEQTLENEPREALLSDDENAAFSNFDDEVMLESGARYTKVCELIEHSTEMHISRQRALYLKE